MIEARKGVNTNPPPITNPPQGGSVKSILRCKCGYCGTLPKHTSNCENCGAPLPAYKTTRNWDHRGNLLPQVDPIRLAEENRYMYLKFKGEKE